jgi:predicted phage terminase large subunit-like protein
MNLNMKKYVENCIEQGAHDSLIKFFKKFEDLDQLSKKVIIWGHIFMPEYLKTKSPDFHYEVVKKFFNGKNEYNAYPRGFGKTTIIQLCIAFSIAHRIDKFIVLLEKSHEEASEVLEGVRYVFQNSVLKKVYGDLSKGAQKSAAGDYYLNGVRLKARGFDKNVRGLKSKDTRPTRIILDDVESDEHIENPDQRRKYLNNYLRGVIPATDPSYGNIKMFGTILHDDSLLQTLINEHGGEVLRAWDSNRKLLWPEVWTPEKLEAKRKDMAIEGRGDAAFYQEYFNEPVSEEDQLFKEEMFKYFNDTQLEEVMKKPVSVYLMVDPAISKRETADFTALVVTVVDRQGRIYVAEIVRKRMGLTDTYRTLFHLYEKWHPEKVGIETTAYQKALVHYIDEQKKKNDMIRTMRVQEIKSDMDKVRKIRQLEPRYNLGNIYHRQNDPMTKTLESELLRFPRGATDDVIDALSSIEQMISFRKRPTRKAYKKFVRSRQVAY